MSRTTFKSVLTVMKEANVPFVFVAGGDGKMGFKVDQDGGKSFVTKSVATLPNLMRKAVMESLPAEHPAVVALAKETTNGDAANGADDAAEQASEAEAAQGQEKQAA